MKFFLTMSKFSHKNKTENNSGMSSKEPSWVFFAVKDMFSRGWKCEELRSRSLISFLACEGQFKRPKPYPASTSSQLILTKKMFCSSSSSIVRTSLELFFSKTHKTFVHCSKFRVVIVKFVGRGLIFKVSHIQKKPGRLTI